jgi:hypothetical protein
VAGWTAIYDGATSQGIDPPAVYDADSLAWKILMTMPVFKILILALIIVPPMPAPVWADDEPRDAAIQRGSQTAKGGFQNEDEVRDKFNHWQTDADARAWLTIMGGGLDGIRDVGASIPRGEKAKTDVEVRVTTADGEKRYGISIKLVSNPNGFNQIDKRWVKSYAAMWDMPPDVEASLKLFVGEVPPTSPGRDDDRMFLDELPPDSQRRVVEFFKERRDDIALFLFAGEGDYAANWLLVNLRGDTPESTRSVLVPTIEAARFFAAGDVTITPHGSLRIGRITMQRKGGDGGRETAKMLQFKVNPADLFDRKESGTLDPGSRPVAEPHHGEAEDDDGPGE